MAPCIHAVRAAGRGVRRGLVAGNGLDDAQETERLAVVCFYDLLPECRREPIGQATRSPVGSDRVEGDAIGGGAHATVRK